MPDTDIKKDEAAPKIATSGSIQVVNPIAQTKNISVNPTDVIVEKENIQQDNLEGKGDDKVNIVADTKVAIDTKTIPALTDEQIKEYFKGVGIEYEGTEKLKEKLNYKPPIELTDEQKTEQVRAKEKRAVDKFIAANPKNTVEQYVAIKGIAEGDLSELSLNTLKKELKDEGFKESEIDDVIKERFYQISDEDLEQYDDETDKEFAKRKKDYGAKLLANHALYTQQRAKNLLAELQQDLESEDLQKQEEVDTASKIDAHFKTLPRKLTLEIGEIDGKAITPIEYEVAETDLADVQSMLKDPDKRQQFLFNTDGSLNLTNLSNVLTRNKYLESATKVAYHEGSTRAIAEFQKTFPATTAYELGVGGSPNKLNGQKSKVASAGTVQRT